MPTTAGKILYEVANLLVLIYSTGIASSYLFLAFVSMVEMRKYIHKNQFVDYNYILSSPFAPGISLIAPAYNESLTIIDNVKSLLSIMYNNFEVIVINDGSKDDTLEKMIIAFNLVRVNYDLRASLSTKPVRGVYKSGAEFFSRVFDPSYYLTAQLSRRNSWGSSHIRYNYAKRFNTYGSQFEADLYPIISKSIYAYLNYGYSESVLFPRDRIGAELFFKLPKSLEISGGVRYMGFDRDTRILMYTGSLGCYVGDYRISIRPFMTPDHETGTSASATMSTRRYFIDAENYVELNAGLGFSPDLRRMQNGTGLSENEIYLLKSQRIGLVWQKAFWTTWAINLSVDVARQELVFDQDEYVIITSSFVSLRKKI